MDNIVFETELDDVTMVHRRPISGPDHAALAANHMERKGGRPRVLVVTDETGKSVYRIPADGSAPVRVAVGDVDPYVVAKRMMDDEAND